MVNCMYGLQEKLGQQMTGFVDGQRDEIMIAWWGIGAAAQMAPFTPTAVTAR